MRSSLPQSRAFSLIEVLIGIMVLSIGLLGLGMVFPVVARQQRIAQDQVRGLSAARSFEDVLSRREDLYLTSPSKVWEVANAVTQGNDAAPYRWQLPSTSSASAPFRLDQTTGEVALTFNGNSSVFSVSQRLWPAPFTSQGDSQFVADFAIRKVDDSTSQVAIFARRVDAGIRIPPASRGVQFTLANILTSPPNAAARFARSPVADDASRKPTLTGADESGRPNYSPLRIMTFQAGLSGGQSGGGRQVSLGAPGATRVRVNTISGETTGWRVLFQLVSQPGQKLVDNLGHVYTVLRPYSEFRGTLRPQFFEIVIDRPLSPEAMQELGRNELMFVFSPQVPSAVSVVTITR